MVTWRGPPGSSHFTDGEAEASTRFHAGDPSSYAPGLSESLETLGKSPGLCEPVIPGTMGFMSVAL